MKLKNTPDLYDMTNEEIGAYLKTCKTFRNASTNLTYMKKAIVERTAFLDEYYTRKVSFTARCVCIINNYQTVADLPKCVICSKTVMIFKHNGQFGESCSNKCANRVTLEKSSELSMKKYGVPHHIMSKEVRTKIVATSIERYGVPYCVAAPEMREKMVDTCMRKYGVSHHSKVPSIRQRIEDTARRNFGEAGIMGTKEWIQKNRDLHMDRFGVPHHFQKLDSHEILNDEEAFTKLIDRRSMKSVAVELGVDRRTISNYIDMYGIERKPMTKRSFLELEIFDFVRSVYDGEVLDNPRVGGWEVDIYIPDLLIGVEVNGVYWHSSKFKERSFHKTKQDACEAAGIRLLQIFEDEWLYSKDIVKNRIMHLLGASDKQRIFARKTKAKEVRHADTKPLYEANHIQGAVGATKHYGLWFEDTLVACMSFQDKREGVWELVRYATGCNVIGGFSKLLKHFIRTHSPAKVTSFADRRWSTGDVYEVNGFTNMGQVPVNYQYVVGDMRVRKENYRRERIERKFNSGELEYFDPDVSERENMELNNIYQIYDAGLIRYELECK